MVLINSKKIGPYILTVDTDVHLSLSSHLHLTSHVCLSLFIFNFLHMSLFFFISPLSSQRTVCCLLSCVLCVLSLGCACVFVVCVEWCVWCGTLKNSVCRFKTPHSTRAFWRHTRRRFESIHGGVLNLHTEVFSVPHTPTHTPPIIEHKCPQPSR